MKVFPVAADDPSKKESGLSSGKMGEPTINIIEMGNIAETTLVDTPADSSTFQSKGSGSQIKVPSQASSSASKPRLRRRGSLASILVPQPEARRTYAKIFDHWSTQALLALALVTTLFLPDLWVIGNPSHDMDVVLNGILIMFFIVFTVEVVLT